MPRRARWRWRPGSRASDRRSRYPAYARFDRRGIAIEVLLGGGSSKGSRKRMLTATKAFFNLGSNQLITPTASMTVGEFVAYILEPSARIRHGNWSTLATPVFGSRVDLVAFGKRLLIAYARELNEFTKDPNATDDIRAFLEWAAKHH